MGVGGGGGGGEGECKVTTILITYDDLLTLSQTYEGGTAERPAQVTLLIYHEC